MADSADNQIDAFIKGVPTEERRVLEEFVQIPNNPDIMPEIMALKIKFGQALTSVSKQIESLRQKTGLSYDDLRERLLKKIRN